MTLGQYLAIVLAFLAIASVVDLARFLWREFRS